MLSPPTRSSIIRLGVLGWPVAHSRSPAIQNAALAAAGLSDWRYQLLPVPPDLLSEVVAALPDARFRGANVTIPHKEAALGLATEPSRRARAIGAANTLSFGPDGHVTADNTDAPGLITSLPHPAKGRTALVLGAGGSARAAVWALLDGGAAEVRVWNRTPERARALCADLEATPVTRARPADILINCTSVGLDGTSPFDRLPVGPEDLVWFGCVVDLVYTPTGTDLVREANDREVATVDGLELLVAQGALSFELWTGLAAPVAVMRSAALGVVAAADDSYGGPR